MTETADTFDVLLGTPAEVPALTVAEAIAVFKKIPFQDAAHEARIAWGFVGKNLSETDANNFAAVMKTKGLSALVIKSNAIAPLPAVENVKSIQFDATVLHITLASGATQVITPAQLSIITAMGLPLRSVSTEKIVEGRTNAQKLLNVGLLLAGIPISVGKKKRVIEKTSIKEDLLFYTDLLTNSPTRRFRIDAQGFNYAFLKERMVHSALQNFKMLLADLTVFAPQARIGKGTRFFLKNMTLSQMGYESFAHLEQETRWLSALA